MFAQTGPGIGIYPTGTEAGIGYRSAKDTRLAIDARITWTNLLGHPLSGSAVNELSLICRIIHLEKVRLHLGLGARADWAIGSNNHKWGTVMPIGIEAFPFPFQHAGLFFETAPCLTLSANTNWNAGIRTAAGIVFYIPEPKAEQQQAPEK